MIVLLPPVSVYVLRHKPRASPSIPAGCDGWLELSVLLPTVDCISRSRIIEIEN